MSNRLSSRLSRLLNLVPYFIANPGMSAAEAAAELGVTTTQLMSDLNQLWVCGLPGISTSERRAIRSAVASVDVNRSGRSMPAENVTSMLSSENEWSMRSPGP